MKCLVTNNVCGNRLYSGPGLTIENWKSVAFDADGKQRKGAGVRCYSSFVGSIMEKLGFAFKAKINGELIYLNKKSFAKQGLRANLVNQILTEAKKNFTFESPQETFAFMLENMASLMEMLYKHKDVFDKRVLKAAYKGLDKFIKQNDGVLDYNCLGKPQLPKEAPVREKKPVVRASLSAVKPAWVKGAYTAIASAA